MQDLYTELTELRDGLNNAITILKQRGQHKAMAERDYRVALQKEMLALREEGIPVTIINDLARGNEEVANLKIARDVSETLYQTALQYIYATKINIEIVQNQMDAERKGI